jgi:hypothetical protein
MLNRLKDVLASFEQNEVRYVVLGGVAAILYGVPRMTYDLDILIDATEENAGRLLKALDEAGFTTTELTNPQRVASSDMSIFEDFVRLDVLTNTPGLSFEEAWQDKQTIAYQGQAFYMVSLRHLLDSKRAAARDIDLQDVSVLDHWLAEEERSS